MWGEKNHRDMTEEKWEAIYKKAEEKVKKAVKTIAVIVAVLLITVGIFWGSIVYERDYKVTDVAASGSPDGKYELILQAVGEADWPFGPADGQLVLREDGHRVVETGFTIYDDGGTVRESIWKVTWYEEYVEVILTGDEQLDEQILLYFDGRKERKP